MSIFAKPSTRENSNAKERWFSLGDRKKLSLNTENLNVLNKMLVVWRGFHIMR